MELRSYLDVVARRRWLVILTTVVVAMTAGVTSSMRPSMYRASASVLLRPGDPAEQLNLSTQKASNSSRDADRYLAGQVDIIKSERVAAEAAKDVSGFTAKELLEKVSVSQAGTTDIVRISATDRDPALAHTIANAFARAYIENRRQNAVESLQRAAREVDAKLSGILAEIARLDAQITAGEPAPIQGKPTPTPNQALSAAREAASRQYQSLYSSQQELEIAMSLKRGEAELIAEADLPTSPASPNPGRDTALGAIVGLLLGLGMAFLRERLDDRLHSREDAEAAAGLPVLAELPQEDQSLMMPNGVSAHLRPAGLLAEATRALRTSLTFLGVDQPLRRIVVTSAGPGEGKSFVAANLAAVYAQAGLRTVLVSADLRRPRIDTLFPEATGGPGLPEVAAGIGTPAPLTNGNSHQPEPENGITLLRAALRPTHIDGLFLLPCGKLPPNPAELLASRRTTELLQHLQTLADIVVIDTPPLLAVTDATVIAPSADGVVIVAATGQTHRSALTRATATISATPTRVLGIVLNKTRDTKHHNHYHAYYQTPPDNDTAPRQRQKVKGA